METLLGLGRDNPKTIIAQVTMMKENIKRGYVNNPEPGEEAGRKRVSNLIEKILSLKDEIGKSDQLIIDLYDDLLDELITSGMMRGGFM